jgi:hypothetical protein
VHLAAIARVYLARLRSENFRPEGLRLALQVPQAPGPVVKPISWRLAGRGPGPAFLMADASLNCDAYTTLAIYNSVCVAKNMVKQWQHDSLRALVCLTGG